MNLEDKNSIYLKTPWNKKAMHLELKIGMKLNNVPLNNFFIKIQ